MIQDRWPVASVSDQPAPIVTPCYPLRVLPQAVIDAQIIPALVEVIWTAEFRTRKEAVWAITNATTGGTAEQTRYLVEQVRRH